MSLFLSCLFYFVTRSEERVTEIKKRLNLRCLLTGEPSSWFPLIEPLKMTWSNAWFLNFLSNGEGLDFCSRPTVLTKLSKVDQTCSKSVNRRVSRVKNWLAWSQQNYQFWTAHSEQNDQYENLYISRHGEARNIKFGHQVNIIQRAPLSTLPQEGVRWLPYNHVTLTNLFISGYREATVIKFGQRKQLLDRSPYKFSPFGGSKVITFWSRSINKSLYFQL